MKQFFLLPLAFALSLPLSHTQTENLDGFMESHKNDRGFTYAFFSKDLFELATQTDIREKDWKKLHNVVQNIGSLRILAADSIEKGLALYKEALNLVPTDEFDELMTVRDGHDAVVRLWAKADNSTVTDLILLVGAAEEFVLARFTGALELADITSLAKLFDAAEAEQLAKTAETLSIRFIVGPNPNNGVFTLTYEDEKDSPAVLSVIDQNGRSVTTLNLSGEPVQEVALRDLPSGIYWLQLKTTAGKVGVKQLNVTKK